MGTLLHLLIVALGCCVFIVYGNNIAANKTWCTSGANKSGANKLTLIASSTFAYLHEMKPVSGDCCCHRQFAAIGGKPEVLKAPPEGLKPLLVWLIHLCDVKSGTEHFVSRGEHDGLRYCYICVLC